ncbi:MAG TPA: TetR/AcrR family transcriptional regulator [Polyangia bacterium]|jgi:AcrR family transcriptional regulator|nr:TetR/AcrR family transcriptional regulator [Polyangia bacterium]
MNARAEQGKRRTEGVRTRGRSARVVSEVLRTVLEELGRVGYAALRVEDVASRSGVNKTTIYRRWPTKAELVAAALRQWTEDPEVPDTGSLRSDLFLVAQHSVAMASSPLGQGLVQTIQAERTSPEVEALTRMLRSENRRRRVVMVERAIERGELPAGTDAMLVVEVIFATIYSRVFTHREPADDVFLQAVIDLVLEGARRGGALLQRDGGSGPTPPG